MSDDNEMLDEFKLEAGEMFESAEEGLLNIDKGLDFNTNFNSVFRSFHSIKGAAGMFGLEALQAHMHKLESLFEAQKKNGEIKKGQIDYFLKGIDAGKLLLEGVASDFKHIELEIFNDSIEKSQTIELPKVLNNKAERIDRKNGLVFIVDDEPDLVDVLSLIIEKNGYAVCKFYNGKEALDSLETLRPDAILSDIMMPKYNGVQMIKAIHEMSYNAPVIFISGNISKETMQEALQYGAYAFIDKPFNNVNVINICRNAVNKSKSMHLLEKSINFILYQFSDLDQYLKSQGKENMRLAFKAELQTILEQRKNLKNIR